MWDCKLMLTATALDCRTQYVCRDFSHLRDCLKQQEDQAKGGFAHWILTSNHEKCFKWSSKRMSAEISMTKFNHEYEHGLEGEHMEMDMNTVFALFMFVSMLISVSMSMSLSIVYVLVRVHILGHFLWVSSVILPCSFKLKETFNSWTWNWVLTKT